MANIRLSGIRLAGIRRARSGFVVLVVMIALMANEVIERST